MQVTIKNNAHNNCKDQNANRHWQITILSITTIIILMIFNSHNSYATTNYRNIKLTNIDQQNNQQNSDPAQNSNQATTLLEKDKPIERELKGGDVHNYTITMEANQYLNVVVEQKGIDVVVAVFDPKGQKVYEVDSPNGTSGPEPVYLITESKGSYKLEVRSLDNTATPGNYQANIVESRVVNEKDIPRVEGYKAFNEAELLANSGRSETINQQMAKYEEAINKFVMAEDPLLEAYALNSLGRLYQSVKGDYDKAETLLKRALTIREKVLGPDHLFVGVTLNDLASVYDSKGDYTKAELFYQRSLVVGEKNYSSEHIEMATSYANLGLLYYNIGKYDKAEPLIQHALTIYEKTFGPEHPGVATILTYLALLYDNKGDFVKAEPLYQRALTIREKVLGPENKDFAIALNNLAAFYQTKGAYEKAEPLYQRALKIIEKTLGPENISIAIPLNNLAQLYYDKRDYEKAEQYYQRALTIREKVLGKEHIDVSISLNSLGACYEINKDYEKAEQYYQRALTIREKVLGKEHYLVANSINNLANLYTAIGAYEKAAPLAQQALAIREKIYGLEHRDSVLALNNLSALYKKKGDIEQAIKYKERANEIGEGILAKNLTIGSQKDKLSYLYLDAIDVDRTISLHLVSAPQNTRVAQLALTTILRRKGRALDAMTDSIAILRRRANKEDQALLDQLASTRTQYAKLSLQGIGKEGATQHQADLKTLEDQIESLEKEVSNRSAEFKAQAQPITLAAIQKAIPNNAVLIEFVSYTQFENNFDVGKRHYAAYILNSSGDPLFADLGDAELIEQASVKLRQFLLNRKSSITKEIKPAARELDKLLMQPIRKLLGDKKRLLISPDYALNLVPFDTLVDEHNKYLVENYEISYLTSGRDLLRLQNGIKPNQPALVMADPDFAQGPGPKFGEESFEPLKRLASTADEANEIKTEFKDATVLTQAQATKNAILAVNRPAILHIATHGYFLFKNDKEGDISEADRIAVRKKLEAGNNEGLNLKNPLLRSGLFFANANAQGEDSILTALEATGLDLWGTKLVVLSACSTGLGDAKIGDGVYGLRRALILAGSESQIISLWPISDKGTKDLMVAYYEALNHKEGRSAGLRKVRLSFLAKPDRAHPYYWASFIQSGEWANLDGKR